MKAEEEEATSLIAIIVFAAVAFGILFFMLTRAS
jgi:hypothetical protein